MKEGIDGNGDECEADDGSHDDADDLDSLEPGRTVPADGLEHAPEAVCEVEPQCHEPDDVEGYYPPFSEGDIE